MTHSGEAQLPDNFVGGGGSEGMSDTRRLVAAHLVLGGELVG